MFLRLFGNAVSEREERLADRGPAPPDRAEKISAGGPTDAGDGQADASMDSGGVTAEAVPKRGLEATVEDSGESIASEGARTHHDTTAAVKPNEQPVTDSSISEVSVTDHPDDEGQPSGVGLPADQRHAVAGPGPGCQRVGRVWGAA